MIRLIVFAISILSLMGCGGAQPAENSSTAASDNGSGDASATSDEGVGEHGTADGAASGDPSEDGFDLNTSKTARDARGATASTLKPTATEALMKLIVVDKETGPIPGIVISMTDPDGQKYYTEETDSTGYAEMLVPVGKQYNVTYLSLGKSDVEKLVQVPNEKNINIKLTLNYKRLPPPPPVIGDSNPEPRLILDGVVFDTGKATLKKESFPHLDRVVEYMTYKRNVRIELSGHTDSVGNPKKNKKLSKERAEACRKYLASKGIDENRVEAVGYGQERPIAPNDTEEGRQKNRRTEAKEL